MFKDMFKTGLFLLVFSALSGLLLSYCESITGPKIAEINKQKTEKARAEVLPTATSFEETDKGFIGKDNTGKVVGMVMEVNPKGYGKEIQMLVGINSDNKITGLKILSHSETPGLGAKVVSPEFQQKFSNLLKDNPNPKFLVKKDGGDVDAISGATITSRAFCKGINEALNKYKLASTGGNK